MALTRVQTTPKASPVATGATVSLTFATPPAVGNGLIVQIVARRNSPGPLWPTDGCTDNRGNTYAQAVARNIATPTRGAAIYYCPRIATSGAPFTITFNAGAVGHGFTICAIEVGGVGAGLRLDQLTSNAASGITATTGLTPALASPEAFIAAVFATSASTSTITVAAATPPFVQSFEHTADSVYTGAGEGDSRIVSLAAGTTQSATWAVSASNPWAAVLAAFEATVVPTPPVAGSTPVAINIDGVDKTTWIRALENFRIENTFGARSTCSFSTRDYDSFETAYRPLVGQSVVIATATDGVWLFGGVITSVTDLPLGNPGVGTVVRVSAASHWHVAGDRLVFKQYPAGLTLKTIVSDLITTYLNPAGIVIDATMPDGPVLPDPLTLDAVTVEGAFQRLSELTGWVHRLLPHKVVEWLQIGESRTFKDYPTFSAANRNILGPVTWEKTQDRQFNRAYVRFGSGVAAVRDDYVAPGAVGHFLLTYQAYLNEDGTIRSRGVVNEDGVDYPLARWGIDSGYLWYFNPENNHLMRETPAPPGAVIWFIYDAQFPQIVMAEDAAAVAADGPKEHLTEAADIFDKAEATTLAQAQIRRYSRQPRRVKISTRHASPLFAYLPGDSIVLDTPSRTLPLATWLLIESSVRVEVDQGLTNTLTLLEGSEAQATWIDFWRNVIGATNTANSTTASGGAIPGATPGGGGGGGGGTGDLTGDGVPNQLALWDAAKHLTVSNIAVSGGNLVSGGTGVGFTINLTASTIVGTLPLANIPVLTPAKLPPTVAYTDVANVFTVGPQRFRTATPNNIEVIGRASDDYSVIQFQSNAVGNPYTGQLHAHPAAGMALQGVAEMYLVAGGNINLSPSGALVLPSNAYHTSLGMINRKYLAIHAAELWVETLVAQQTLATIGGRILVGPTTVLTRDFIGYAGVDAGYTFIWLKHQVKTPAGGDWGSTLLLESGGKFEAVQIVDTAVVESDGSYRYTAARLQGLNHPTFYAGDAAFDTGVTGDGFIDLFSRTSIAYNVGGPTIVGNVRTAAWPGAWSYWGTRWAIGNLNGMYGYGGQVYGAAFGDPGLTNLTVDQNLGVRIRHGNVNKFWADTSGNLTLDGNLTIGAAGIFRTESAVDLNNGVGIYMAGGAMPVWRVGDPAGTYPNAIRWDGLSLKVGFFTVSGANWDGGNVSLNASGLMNVGGASATGVWMSSYDSAGARIWIGNAVSSSGTFKVNSDGTMAAAQVSSNNNMYAHTYRFWLNMTHMYVHGGTNGALTLAAGPAWALFIYEVTAGINGMFPSTTGTVILGQPTNRWANIFTNAVDNASDRSVKTNIAPGTLGLAFLERLPVHRFAYLDDPARTPGQYGFMTDEVRAALGGEPFAHLHEHGLDYARFVPVLTKAIQELAARVRELES